MKIGKPFKDFKNAPYPQGSITQGFGENPTLYSKICPIDGQCLHGHNGMDLVAPWGTPLYAVEDMKVIEAKDAVEGYGLYVRGTNSLHEWTYGHLSKIGVEPGQILKQGDYIGNMGNTGFVVSSQDANGFWKYNPYLGTHLHLGMRNLDSRGRIADYSNGFFGSTDFKDLLPDFDPINDDIPGFISQLRTLLIRLQNAGIPLNRIQ